MELICLNCHTSVKEFLISICDRAEHAICGGCYRLMVCAALQENMNGYPLDVKYQNRGQINCPYCDHHSAPIQIHTRCRLPGKLWSGSDNNCIQGSCPNYDCHCYFDNESLEVVGRHVLVECPARFVCMFCSLPVMPEHFQEHVRLRCPRVRCNTADCHVVGPFAQIQNHLQLHNAVAQVSSPHVAFNWHELKTALTFQEQNPHNLVLPAESFSGLLKLVEYVRVHDAK